MVHAWFLRAVRQQSRLGAAPGPSLCRNAFLSVVALSQRRDVAGADASDPLAEVARVRVEVVCDSGDASAARVVARSEIPFHCLVPFNNYTLECELLRVPPAPATYPIRLGLTADVGQTVVSNRSFAKLAALEPDAVLLSGDLSYAAWKSNFGRPTRMLSP